MAGEDVADGGLAGDVLDVAAAEVVAGGEGEGVRVGEVVQHRLPDFRAGLERRLLELHLEDEAAGEGVVAEVRREVRRRDEDAVQVLQLLEDDVLDGVHHLVHAPFRVLQALGEDGVGLVEEEDGRQLVRAAHLAVGREDALDDFLGIAHPLALELGHVHGEDGAAGAAGELVGAGGLAAAGAAGEQDREALPHPHLFQPLLDAGEVGGFQQGGQPLHLLGDLAVVEELPDLDVRGRDEIPVAGGLGLGEDDLREEGLLDAVGEGQLLGVLEGVVTAEDDEAGLLDVRPPVGDGALQALVVLHKVGQGQQLVDGEVRLAEGDEPIAEGVEDAALGVREPLVVQGGLRLAAEFQLLVLVHQLVEVLEQALRVDVVPEILREHEADAGEELLGDEAGALQRLEFRVLLDGPDRFAAHHVAIAAVAAMDDDAQILQLPERFAKAQELDVRAPDVVGQVVVVAAVARVVLQDGGQQHGGAVPDGEALAHAPDVLLQLAGIVFGEAFGVHLLVDAVQAGGHPRDREGPGAPVLVVGRFFSSHPVSVLLGGVVAESLSHVEDGHVGGLLGEAFALGDLLVVEVLRQVKENPLVALLAKAVVELLHELVPEQLAVRAVVAEHSLRLLVGVVVPAAADVLSLALVGRRVVHRVLGDGPNPRELLALGRVVGFLRTPHSRDNVCHDVLLVSLGEEAGELLADIAHDSLGGCRPIIFRFNL